MSTEPVEASVYPTDGKQERQAVARLVGKRVIALQEQYCSDNSTASSKAALAQLRRAGSSTSATGRPATEEFFVDGNTYVPATCYRLRDGREVVLGDAPTVAEKAVFVAMTTYAFHQQSRKEKMHEASIRPGVALAMLVKPGKGKRPLTEAAVRRRFEALVTASSFEELVSHLRAMVRLLRDKRIVLDYGRLASDLMSWQSPYGRPGVRLSWSRDFERLIRSDYKDEEIEK